MSSESSIPPHILELHSLFVKNFEKKLPLNFQNVKKVFIASDATQEDSLDLNTIFPTLQNYLINIKDAYIHELIAYYTIHENAFVTFQEFYSILTNQHFWNEKVSEKLHHNPHNYAKFNAYSASGDEGDSNITPSEKKRRSILKHAESFHEEGHHSSHHVHFGGDSVKLNAKTGEPVEEDEHKEVHFVNPAAHHHSPLPASKYYIKEIGKDYKRFPIETVEDFQRRRNIHGLTATLDHLVPTADASPAAPTTPGHHAAATPSHHHAAASATLGDYTLNLLKRHENLYRFTMDGHGKHVICLVSKENPTPLEEEEDKLF